MTKILVFKTQKQEKSSIDHRGRLFHFTKRGKFKQMKYYRITDHLGTGTQNP